MAGILLRTSTASLPLVTVPTFSAVTWESVSQVMTFEWDTANFAQWANLSIYVAIENNVANSSLCEDITVKKDEGLIEISSVTNSNVTYDGEGDYYYWLRAVGDGISYSTQPVFSTAFGPVTVIV
jgi:hypothetical protein